VDFPAFVFAHAAGERLVAASEPRPGVRMRWLGGDIRWLRATLSQGGRPDAPPAGRALAAFGAEFFRPAHYDYFELDDPLPALAATAGFAATAVRRLPVRAPVQVGHAR
jgi:hypothetical protein